MSVHSPDFFLKNSCRKLAHLVLLLHPCHVQIFFFRNFKATVRTFYPYIFHPTSGPLLPDPFLKTDCSAPELIFKNLVRSGSQPQASVASGQLQSVAGGFAYCPSSAACTAAAPAALGYAFAGSAGPLSPYHLATYSVAFRWAMSCAPM